MAATDANLRASFGMACDSTYAPQGVTSTLNSTTVSQTANSQMTTLTYGTTSGKVDLISCSDRTLTATTAVTYDLYTGTDLKDLNGLTCAFRKIKFISITIISGGDATGVQIGGAAATQWVAFFADVTDKAKIFPSGPPFVQGSPAGVAVGAATNLFKVENLGAVSVTYRILIAGTSV